MFPHISARRGRGGIGNSTSPGAGLGLDKGGREVSDHAIEVTGDTGRLLRGLGRGQVGTTSVPIWSITPSGMPHWGCWVVRQTLSEYLGLTSKKSAPQNLHLPI
jgi:hypothetical protein